MNSILKKEDGFSLIEVVVSLCILAFGILSLFMLLTSGIKAQTSANRISLSVNQATDQIEQLLNKKYDDPELKDVKNVSQEGESCAKADHCPAGQNGDYRIFWNVREDYPIENLKTIKVFVEYTKGNKKKVALEYIKPGSI